MEAFLKTGKVGANPGGSGVKPAGKSKGEKKQGPVGCSQNHFLFRCAKHLKVSNAEGDD